MQIGGSLIKLCFWSFEEVTHDLGGRLNFRKFPTDRIDACIEYMKRLAVKHRLRNDNNENGSDASLCVVATGGGAYKFYDKIKEGLGVEVMREDEMECLIIGTYLCRCWGLCSEKLTACNRPRLFHISSRQ